MVIQVLHQDLWKITSAVSGEKDSCLIFQKSKVLSGSIISVNISKSLKVTLNPDARQLRGKMFVFCLILVLFLFFSLSTPAFGDTLKNIKAVLQKQNKGNLKLLDFQSTQVN